MVVTTWDRLLGCQGPSAACTGAQETARKNAKEKVGPLRSGQQKNERKKRRGDSPQSTQRAPNFRREDGFLDLGANTERSDEKRVPGSGAGRQFLVDREGVRLRIQLRGGEMEGGVEVC